MSYMGIPFTDEKGNPILFGQYVDPVGLTEYGSMTLAPPIVSKPPPPPPKTKLRARGMGACAGCNGRQAVGAAVITQSPNTTPITPILATFGPTTPVVAPSSPVRSSLLPKLLLLGALGAGGFFLYRKLRKHP